MGIISKLKWASMSTSRFKSIFPILSVLFFMVSVAQAADAPSLKKGFGKVKWGMSFDEVLSAYQVVLKNPLTPKPEGIWAFKGPSKGELTVSGEALGEKDIRSVSFGIHKKYGLVIAHIRFNNTNDPSFLDKLLPKWTARLGQPQERLPGPKVIWTVGDTHIELTYHTVSPRHPTPSDHLAIVNWNIPLMEKVELDKPEIPFLPDVEKLGPMPKPHQKK